MDYKVGDKVIYQGQPATVIDIQGNFLRISYMFGQKKVQQSQVKPANNTQNTPPPPQTTPPINPNNFEPGEIVLYKNQKVTVVDIDGLIAKITSTSGIKKVPKTELKKIQVTPTNNDITSPELTVKKDVNFSTIKLNLNDNPKVQNPTASIKFSPKNILSKKLKNLISVKPMLISVEELQEIQTTPTEGFNDLNFSTGFVGYDDTLDVLQNSDKPVSPMLVNWVEPYIVGGVRKTLFYTETNSGLKVGERVFIVNGNYDSDEVIKIDKYKRGRDGYKVLFVDKCQIVLDIDYTGISPYEEGDEDEFIKVYCVDNQEQFDWINRQITTRGGNFDYKYNFYQNNFVFTNSNLSGSSNQFGFNSGITAGPGFYVRDDRNLTSNGTYSWINISSSFITSGSFSYVLSPTYSNNNRLKVLGGSFTYNYQDFKEGFVYNWEVGVTQSKWVVDVKYSKSLISKSNFRDGNFDGVFNGGIYGRQNKKITWTGNKSTWNTGTLLNTIWKKGTINSKFTLPESYFTEVDESGVPYQKVNAPNNNGRGFNFLIDSEIQSCTIENASILNTQIGTVSSTYSIVESHLINQSMPFANQIKKAYFEDSEITDVSIENSEVRNLRSKNSLFDNVKSINSYFEKSVVKNSDFISDEVIKVLGYDEFNMAERRTIS